MGTVYSAARRAIHWVGTSVSGVAAINLLLAVCAFVKDLLMAACLGTSPAADALSLAFFIPDTIGNNILASALGVACVPMFSKLLAARQLQNMRRVFLQVSWFAVALSAVCLLLLYPGRSIAVHLLAGGLSPAALTLCRQLLTFLLPTLALFPLAAIWSAGLQAQGRFTVSAWGPVVYNAFCIVGVSLAFVLHLGQQQAAMLTAAGFFAGVIGMAAFLGRAFFQKGRRSWQSPPQMQRTQKALSTPRASADHEREQMDGKRADGKRVVRLFLAYLLLLISTQGVYAVERHLASLLGSGTVAGLNYAFRLGQFANWVFVAALTTVLLPSVSRALAEFRYAEARAELKRAVWITLVLTVPISVGMFCLRVPLVALLFEHGAFDRQSTHLTSVMLSGYALAIVPQALTAVLLRYFLAVERMRMPVVAGLIAFGVNVLADWQLAKGVGAAALGDGAAIAAWFNAAVLFLCLYGEMKKWGEQGSEQKPLSDYHAGL